MNPFRVRTSAARRRLHRALIATTAGAAVTLAAAAFRLASGAGADAAYLLAGALGVFLLSALALGLHEAAVASWLALEGQRQVQAMIQLRPLIGPLPLHLGGWAADPLFAYHIAQLITEHRPGLVVELGSGSSTVIVARCLQQLGQGRVVSLDHDRVYADATRRMLQLHGVQDIATVVDAPLGPRHLEDRAYRWYSAAYEPRLTEPVDVVIVDGPPGNTAPRARYPALPLLRRFLARDWAILMDDGNRPDERWIARAWAAETGASASYLEGGKGGWLLRARPGG